MIAGKQNKAVIIKNPTHSGLLIWLIPKLSKYFCHFKLSISHPAGADNQVLENAIKDDNKAYWKAEKLILHKLDK